MGNTRQQRGGSRQQKSKGSASHSPIIAHRQTPQLFAVIMGGMVLWGAYVAIGAYLYNYDPWRGVIVMASVGLFLGFWLLLLWNQSRNKKP